MGELGEMLLEHTKKRASSFQDLLEIIYVYYSIPLFFTKLPVGATPSPPSPPFGVVPVVNDHITPPSLGHIELGPVSCDLCKRRIFQSLQILAQFACGADRPVSSCQP